MIIRVTSLFILNVLAAILFIKVIANGVSDEDLNAHLTRMKDLNGCGCNGLGGLADCAPGQKCCGPCGACCNENCTCCPIGSAKLCCDPGTTCTVDGCVKIRRQCDYNSDCPSAFPICTNLGECVSDSIPIVLSNEGCNATTILDCDSNGDRTSVSLTLQRCQDVAFGSDAMPISIYAVYQALTASLSLSVFKGPGCVGTPILRQNMLPTEILTLPGNFCVEWQRKCYNDSDCPTSYLCNQTSGVCKLNETSGPVIPCPAIECLTDDDCTIDQTCEGLLDGPRTCVNASDCSSSDCFCSTDTCYHGVCNTSVTCQADEDCASDSICCADICVASDRLDICCNLQGHLFCGGECIQDSDLLDPTTCCVDSEYITCDGSDICDPTTMDTCVSPPSVSYQLLYGNNLLHDQVTVPAVLDGLCISYYGQNPFSFKYEYEDTVSFMVVDIYPGSLDCCTSGIPSTTLYLPFSDDNFVTGAGVNDDYAIAFFPIPAQEAMLNRMINKTQKKLLKE